MTLYFTINQLQVYILNISCYIPSRVNIAELGVEYHIGNKESFFSDEQEYGRWECLEDSELSCLGVLGMAMWLLLVYSSVSVCQPPPKKATQSTAKTFL